MRSINVKRNLFDQISSRHDILKLLVHRNKKVHPSAKMNKKVLSLCPSSSCLPSKLLSPKPSIDSVTPLSEFIKSPLMINSIDIQSSQIKKISKMLVASKKTIKEKEVFKPVIPKSSKPINPKKTIPETGILGFRLSLPIGKTKKHEGLKKRSDFSSNFNSKRESTYRNNNRVLVSDRKSHDSAKLNELCKFKTLDSILVKGPKSSHLIHDKIPKDIKEFSSLNGWEIIN